MRGHTPRHKCRRGTVHAGDGEEERDVAHGGREGFEEHCVRREGGSALLSVEKAI